MGGGMSALSEYMQEEGLSFTSTPNGEHAVCNADSVKLMGLARILDKANIPFEQKPKEGIFIADDYFPQLEDKGVSIAPSSRPYFTAAVPAPAGGQYTAGRDRKNPLMRDGEPLVDTRGNKLF